MNTNTLQVALFALYTLSEGIRIFGENTWNQITTGGPAGYVIRLHLGSQIDKSGHANLIKYLQDTTSASNRQNLQQLFASLKCLDHPAALLKLGEAVVAGQVTHWRFVPSADVNENGELYRIDVSTEAPIRLEDLLDIQRYLETRRGPGRSPLAAIFKDAREDAIACEILNLNS